MTEIRHIQYYSLLYILTITVQLIPVYKLLTHKSDIYILTFKYGEAHPLHWFISNDRLRRGSNERLPLSVP